MPTARSHDLALLELFAGAGGSAAGACTAARQLGYTPRVVAVNHDALAVEAYRLNHPETQPLCRAVEDISWSALVDGMMFDGRVDLLLASPSCTHFSKALGGGEVNEQPRATAWAIPQLLESTALRYGALLENVVEMKAWGPTVVRQGKRRAIKDGSVFAAWLATIRAYGYDVEHRAIEALDFGAASTRERLFIQIRPKGQRFVWPSATHGPTTSQPHQGAESVIDWSLPMTRLRDARIKRGGTSWERATLGLRRYDTPFITRRAQWLGVNAIENDIRPVSMPLHTITTKSSGDFGLVVPNAFGKGREGFRWLTVSELAAAMGYPVGHRFTGTDTNQRKQLGNGVAPAAIAAHVAALLPPVGQGRLCGALPPDPSAPRPSGHAGAGGCVKWRRCASTHTTARSSHGTHSLHEGQRQDHRG